RARLVARIAFAKRMSGRPLESRSLVEHVLHSLPPDSSGALGLTLELAIDHYWRGEFAPMHDVAQDVWDRARERDELLFATWVAAAESATDAALLTGNDQFAMWALWADAMVCSVAGDTARALASAREAAARADKMSETFFSSLSRLHLAAALNAAGDAAGARAE